MKRLLLAFAAVALLLDVGTVLAQPLGWFNYKNFMFIGTPCVGYAPYPPPVQGALCSDTANGQVYTYHGTAFTSLPSPSATPT